MATRRTFLQSLAVGAAATSWAAERRAGERTRVGVIGVGGMGRGHVQLLAERDDVDVAWVCDVDRQRLANAAQLVVDRGRPQPQADVDLRRVLDDRDVEAVWIATPDHWHAPAALLALAAGKHVYVEKPCSHNVREGRLLVEAATRSGRTLQVGTQSRSTDCVREAIDRVRGGEIGEVLVAKAWNSQLRGSIGRKQPSDPPAELDYELWLGPAAWAPYRANLLHGSWRWFRNFGCGDAGNDGVHDLDLALWGLGVETHPHRVACLGGKSFFDDDQEFPDTQYAVCEYAPLSGGRAKRLIFEQRIWSPYVQEGYENGAAFYGTQGLLVIGHSVGWKLYGPKNKLLAERTGAADLVAHHDNFLRCVRGEASASPADAAIGHRAATVVHLANLSARLGRALDFDPVSETTPHDAGALPYLSREYRAGHWAAPE